MRCQLCPFRTHILASSSPFSVAEWNTFIGGNVSDILSAGLSLTVSDIFLLIFRVCCHFPGLLLNFSERSSWNSVHSPSLYATSNHIFETFAYSSNLFSYGSDVCRYIDYIHILIKYVGQNGLAQIENFSLFMTDSCRLYHSTCLQVPHLRIWSFRSSLLFSSSMHFRLYLPLHTRFPPIPCVTGLPFRSHLLFPPYFISFSVRKDIYLHISLFIHFPRYTPVFFLPCIPSLMNYIALPAIFSIPSSSSITLLPRLPFSRISIYIFLVLSPFLRTPSPPNWLCIYSLLTAPPPTPPINSNRSATVLWSGCFRATVFTLWALPAIWWQSWCVGGQIGTLRHFL